MCVNIFYIARNKISAWSDKRQRYSPLTPIIKITLFCNVVTKVGNFYNGVLWGNFSFFVGSNWNFVPGYIKNVDTHHERFSSKKQVIKKLSPKSLWQTYMKWTVNTHKFRFRYKLTHFQFFEIFIYINKHMFSFY